MCKYFLPLLYCFFSLPLFAQDTALMHELLQRINDQQHNKDSFFIKGVFPSYIASQPHFSKRKKDNNVFFTALIDYTLNHLATERLLNSDIYDSIHARALAMYPCFANRKGLQRYNFWRTDTAYIFPYTNWVYKVKKNTALPDDMDDTVLSLLAQHTDSVTASAVHTDMQQYINDDKRKAKAIDKKYRRYGAYSVWFGKRFPAVLDVCVLSNALYFVQQYNLPWTTADSASLQVITIAISNRDYIKKPLAVSPYYGNTSIILYHIARLMSSRPIPQLEVFKMQLLTTAVQQFARTKNPLEKAILCTAIMRLGYVPPRFEMPNLAAIEHNDLPFFIGNIPSYFPSYVRQVFYKKRLGLFYHYCPAYNDALFVEYLALKFWIADNADE